MPGRIEIRDFQNVIPTACFVRRYFTFYRSYVEPSILIFLRIAHLRYECGPFIGFGSPRASVTPPDRLEPPKGSLVEYFFANRRWFTPCGRFLCASVCANIFRETSVDFNLFLPFFSRL